MQSGGACSPIGNRDVDNLMDYYDYHREFDVTEFDPSRIDWLSTGLDGASLVLSVVSLNAASQSAKALVANTGVVLFGGASAGYSASKGDNTGAWLSAGGFAPPPFGTLASGASVIRDVSAAFYYVPFVPPIAR
jgi:hypothetical protein